MKLCTVFAASALLLPTTAFARQQASTAGITSARSAQLQIAQATDIPGSSLPKGSYSIRVADRLQDRLIIQIQRTGAQSFASVLAYPNPGLRGGSFTGPITFLSGLKGKPTLRGYAFAGGPVVEFVFPKADAVALAKDNNVRVMAVDTASEGKVALPNLSQTDMSEVTLWMLTPTAVEPSTQKPGIQAARYQAPPANETATNTPPQPLATPATPANSIADSNPTSTAAPSRSARPAAVTPTVAPTRPVHVRPNVKTLPHTASQLPLLVLAALLSSLGGAMLTLRRYLLVR